MAKKESSQKRLGKTRPPRVHITYDVHTDGAIEQKELPFVAGVLGDFSGQSEVEKKRLSERKFVDIDKENFDSVMGKIEPRAVYRVKNKLSANGEGGEFAVDVRFKSMEDFRPESVIKQIDPLKNLMEARTKLSDLRNKMAGNEKLEEILKDVISNTEQLSQLAQETQKNKKED
jgi:type VI secretion system protein ImpB